MGEVYTQLVYTSNITKSVIYFHSIAMLYASAMPLMVWELDFKHSSKTLDLLNTNLDVAKQPLIIIDFK